MGLAGTRPDAGPGRADAGPPSGAINGWIDHGKLIRLKPEGDLVSKEIW